MVLHRLAAIRVVLAVIATFWATPALAKPLWLVDFVYLAEGNGLAEHDEFVGNAEVIAKRHGIERRISLDRIAGFAYPGPIAPDRIDLWFVPDFAALTSWDNDPDWVWYADLAGNVLDSQSSRYLAQAKSISPMTPGQMYLIDILQFGPEIAAPAFENYAADLVRSSAVSGLKLSAALGDVQHLTGPFGRVDWMHMYFIESTEALDKVLADPNYRKGEVRRRDLLERNASARQLYRAQIHFEPSD